MVAMIRNCNFILECLARWEDLGPTEQENERYCGVCQRKVFMCRTDDELRARIEQNDCVAVQLPERPMRPDYPRVTVGVPSREQDWEDGGS